MIPKNLWNISSIKEETSRLRQLTVFLQNMYDCVNNGLTFQENMRGTLINIDVIIGENAISHTLNFVANNYILVRSNVANVSLYDGANRNTKSIIYINSTVNANITIFVF